MFKGIEFANRKSMKAKFLFKKLIFSCLFLSSIVRAENRVGVLDYMETSIPSGYFVCEPGDPGGTDGQTANCFFLNDFSRRLASEKGSSVVMEAGSISDKQGAFLEVKLDQLATSISPGKFKSSQIFDFYIKIHWTGVRPGPSGMSLEDSLVVKGQVVKNVETGLVIRITSLPDLFMPSLELVEIFGRKAFVETDELESDVKLWISLLVSPVLKSYFNNLEPTELGLP